MFNLITTLLICLGMSNSGMPISNYKENKEELKVELTNPKQANSTTDYSLVTSRYNDQASGTTSGNYYLFYRTGQYNMTSAYINLIGNVYTHEACRSDDHKIKYITSYEENIIDGVYNGNKLNLLHPKVCYAFQITPYNYNVDNQANIRLHLNVASTVIGGMTYFSMARYYYNIRTYQSTEDLSQFIGMQPNNTNPITIEEEITNIDNGYYYTYQEETKLLMDNSTANSQARSYRDFTLTPNRTNYVFIIFEIMGELDQEWYEDNVQTIPSSIQGNWMCQTTTATESVLRPYGSNDLTITGTNIIPDGTYEVIDIPGIMFEILGMPFTFISTAFNLTLFPGTPYQINISNLFLAIIGLFVFVFLLKILIKAGVGMGG